MTSPAADDWGERALNRDADKQARLVAISALANIGSRRSVDLLIELGERADEDAEILRAAGSGLASLLKAGQSVSEWDIRNLTEVAGDGFFE